MSQVTDYNIANGNGAAVRTDLNAVFDAGKTWNSGASGPANPSAHMQWLDSDLVGILKRNAANGGWNQMWKFDSDAPIPFCRTLPLDLKERAIANGDATPDVSGALHHVTANAGGTTITALDGALFAGHRVSIRAGDGNTTIAAALTRSGMAIPLVADDWLEFEYDGATWNQIGGTVGMGRYVPLADPDAVDDMIAITQTTFTNVDLSNDGVRAGATAARLGCHIQPGTAFTLQARRDGSSDTSEGNNLHGWNTGVPNRGQVIVPLGPGAITEMRCLTSGVSGTILVWVTGYWI